jgi:hypothetical protein
MILLYSRPSILEEGHMPSVSIEAGSSDETPVMSLVHCNGRVNNCNLPIKVFKKNQLKRKNPSLPYTVEKI